MYFSLVLEVFRLVKMSCVHYKFSSKLDYNTVTFDGLHITLSELKKQIMTRERLKATDCDLQITNAQTREGMLSADTLTHALLTCQPLFSSNCMLYIDHTRLKMYFLCAVLFCGKSSFDTD